MLDEGSESIGSSAERGIMGGFSFEFGRIDQVVVDAVVCPQKTFNDSDSLERQLLEVRYGREPFDKAREMGERFKKDLQKIGIKGEIDLPSGFSVATPVEKEGLGVKRIIHTNIAEKEGVSDVVRLAIGNALEKAAEDPDIKTVAIPLFGDINPQTLRPRISSIVGGIRDYFAERPDSTIERVILVINADDTRENARRVMKILSLL